MWKEENDFESVLDDIETLIEENESLKESTIRFLEDIYEWIEQHCYASDAHREAIKKIEKRGR